MYVYVYLYMVFTLWCLHRNVVRYHTRQPDIIIGENEETASTSMTVKDFNSPDITPLFSFACNCYLNMISIVLSLFFFGHN